MKWQKQCLKYKKKLSDANSGVNNPFYGKRHTDAVYDIIKANNKKIVSCPHCGKEGKQGGMLRWHFSHCKLNKDNI